ncbi:MAG: VTT domain-containing protein [Desulfobulbaceae bacterium]|nr:VTT domain-containing protein [Desulfobulbaceae bacterium]
MNKNLVRKGGIVAVILLIFLVFYRLDLGRYLSLEYLKASHDHFAGLYAAYPVSVILAYMGIYIVATAFSLPGAVILTLAGGGLFGLGVGLVVVSFASSIGATLACLVSRFVMREAVQSRFADKLIAINEGVEREGPFYLFSLRLVPIFPFFVINLVMGVTRMPALTYYWVSQVGMLPGTIVYVNAGKELAKIDTLSGILSPSLLASFVILGLFPITVKKLLAWYKARTAGG